MSEIRARLIHHEQESDVLICDTRFGRNRKRILFTKGQLRDHSPIPRILRKKKCSNVDNVIPFSLGYLACLYGSMIADGSVLCKLFLFENDRKNQTIDLNSCGFQCPMCDRHDQFEKCSNILSPNKQSSENCSDHHLDILVSLFPELLYDDSSEEAQSACVRVIPRILMHTPQDFLKTKHKFTKETDNGVTTFYATRSLCSCTSPM